MLSHLHMVPKPIRALACIIMFLHPTCSLNDHSALHHVPTLPAPSAAATGVRPPLRASAPCWHDRRQQDGERVLFGRHSIRLHTACTLLWALKGWFARHAILHAFVLATSHCQGNLDAALRGICNLTVISIAGPAQDMLSNPEACTWMMPCARRGALGVLRLFRCAPGGSWATRSRRRRRPCARHRGAGA